MSNITFNFVGKNFVVTGASSGMGRQLSIELAEAGANVLIIARRKTLLEEVALTYPRQITVGVCDVTNGMTMRNVIENFVEKNGKLDGGIYAAGIDALTPLRMFDENIARRIFDVSFWGAVKFLQIITSARLSNQEASFVVFSSVRARAAEKGLFAYGCAKASVTHAIKSFAKELNKRRIRVNSISPGWVNTAMTQATFGIHNVDEVISSSLLGVGEPHNVTGMVMFLLSDRASWITGTDIVVDGGYLA